MPYCWDCRISIKYVDVSEDSTNPDYDPNPKSKSVKKQHMLRDGDQKYYLCKTCVYQRKYVVKCDEQINQEKLSMLGLRQRCGHISEKFGRQRIELFNSFYLELNDDTRNALHDELGKLYALERYAPENSKKLLKSRIKNKEDELLDKTNDKFNFVEVFTAKRQVETEIMRNYLRHLYRRAWVSRKKATHHVMGRRGVHESNLRFVEYEERSSEKAMYLEAYSPSDSSSNFGRIWEKQPSGEFTLREDAPQFWTLPLYAFRDFNSNPPPWVNDAFRSWEAYRPNTYHYDTQWEFPHQIDADTLAKDFIRNFTHTTKVKKKDEEKTVSIWAKVRAGDSFKTVKDFEEAGQETLIVGYPDRDRIQEEEVEEKTEDGLSSFKRIIVGKEWWKMKDSQGYLREDMLEAPLDACGTTLEPSERFQHKYITTTDGDNTLFEYVPDLNPTWFFYRLLEGEKCLALGLAGILIEGTGDPDGNEWHGEKTIPGFWVDTEGEVRTGAKIVGDPEGRPTQLSSLFGEGEEHLLKRDPDDPSKTYMMTKKLPYFGQNSYINHPRDQRNNTIVPQEIRAKEAGRIIDKDRDTGKGHQKILRRLQKLLRKWGGKKRKEKVVFKIQKVEFTKEVPLFPTIAEGETYTVERDEETGEETYIINEDVFKKYSKEATTFLRAIFDKLVDEVIIDSRTKRTLLLAMESTIENWKNDFEGTVDNMIKATAIKADAFLSDHENYYQMVRSIEDVLGVDLAEGYRKFQIKIVDEDIVNWTDAAESLLVLTEEERKKYGVIETAVEEIPKKANERSKRQHKTSETEEDATNKLPCKICGVEKTFSDMSSSGNMDICKACEEKELNALEKKVKEVFSDDDDDDDDDDEAASPDEEGTTSEEEKDKENNEITQMICGKPYTKEELEKMLEEFSKEEDTSTAASAASETEEECNPKRFVANAMKVMRNKGDMFSRCADLLCMHTYLGDVEKERKWSQDLDFDLDRAKIEYKEYEKPEETGKEEKPEKEADLKTFRAWWSSFEKVADKRNSSFKNEYDKNRAQLKTLLEGAITVFNRSGKYIEEAASEGFLKVGWSILEDKSENFVKGLASLIQEETVWLDDTARSDSDSESEGDSDLLPVGGPAGQIFSSDSDDSGEDENPAMIPSPDSHFINLFPKIDSTGFPLAVTSVPTFVALNNVFSSKCTERKEQELNSFGGLRF